MFSSNRKKAEKGFNTVYSGERLNRVAFPMGGIGAGMICLEGTGALSQFSIRNKPGVFKTGNQELREQFFFSALSLKSRNRVRVLEGPIQSWKIFGGLYSGGGLGHTSFGFPRFEAASFSVRFPFGTVVLEDARMPLNVEICGWSPFIPGDADNSSLPVASLEYRFTNTSQEPLDAVYSFHAKNLMAISDKGNAVGSVEGGLVFSHAGTKEKPWEEGAFCARVTDTTAAVDCAWFRGAWFDPVTMVWRNMQSGNTVANAPICDPHGPSEGGSIYVPFTLAPGEGRTICLLLAWYVPKTDMRFNKDPECAAGCGCGSASGGASKALPTYVPWYAGRFPDIRSVASYWRDRYQQLRADSKQFSDCFYDTSLPPEVIEAVAANLTILKSPTVLRQTDGRIWGWEGCGDEHGCCNGSCTHVWNYAQALPHLFPELERTLRQTEFNESQDDRGHQAFRSALPVRTQVHEFYAAADGQLGGIMKAYREWRASGDTDWMRALWPKVKASLNYCIGAWDPGRKGVLEEPHHNTYDIEFWGADGMCSSFYLGALKAAIEMGRALNEDVQEYASLYQRGRIHLEQKLFNGEYFEQDIRWEGLNAGNPVEASKKSMGGQYSPEAMAILDKEGPKYQYGKGCLSDGILGAWMAEVCGVGVVLDEKKIRKTLRSIYRYNFRKDLSEHGNPQRPGYALGHEGGLLMCSWPKGERLTFPFPYSDEVWTGIEYQVASHLMMHGMVKEGLTLVRACRSRYDGCIRNPFDEYECGHWYARAMSSYALLQGLTGARYDAVDKTLHLKPAMEGDFRSFIATSTGYGTVGVKNGEPFVEIRKGTIDVLKIER